MYAILKRRKALMNNKNSRQNLLYRLLLSLAFIVIAAALRIAPHPWNFTPMGAMALFSGTLVRDRRLAFLFPMATLFVGDIFISFHKLMPIVYASFLLSVLIGRWIQNHRSLGRISAATLLGAIQFFLVTNFGVWALGNFSPHTFAGLTVCYAAGVDRKSTRLNSSHRCISYAVLCLEKKNFNAVHFKRTLTTCSVDPNFGRRVRNSRELNILHNTYQYGYNIAIAF